MARRVGAPAHLREQRFPFAVRPTAVLPVGARVLATMVAILRMLGREGRISRVMKWSNAASVFRVSAAMMQSMAALVARPVPGTTLTRSPMRPPYALRTRVFSFPRPPKQLRRVGALWQRKRADMPRPVPTPR